MKVKLCIRGKSPVKRNIEKKIESERDTQLGHPSNDEEEEKEEGEENVINVVKSGLRERKKERKRERERERERKRERERCTTERFEKKWSGGELLNWKIRQCYLRQW